MAGPGPGLLSLALLLALALTACSEPSGSGPRRIQGWILLNDDPAAIDRSLEAAQRYGVDQLQLSHDLVMNADDLLGDDPETTARRASIAALTERAGRLGMDTFIWAHELSQTGILVCYDPTDPLWTARAEAYLQLFAALPALDGVVLMFGSADAPPWFTVCTCDWCQENYPDADPLQAPPNAERIRAITERIGGVIVEELGKSLVARTFVHEPAENDWHAEGFAAVEDVAFLGMHKSEVQDWQPYNPPDPTMGRDGVGFLVEMDAAGEYVGLSELPFCAPDYFAWRLAHALEKGAVGTAVRIERGSSSALGTPNEINLLAIARRLADPAWPMERVWQEFVLDHYGLDTATAAGQTLAGVLRDSFAVRLKSHYVLGIWALNKNSDLPPSTDLDQFADRGDLPKFDPDWQPVWDALDTPDRDVVVAVFQEGQEAVDLASADLTRLLTVTDQLDAAVAADLQHRFRHQLRAAEAWRNIKLFIWADRARGQEADPTTLSAWMAWAHADLRRVQEAMRAEGLDQVALASPAAIERFLQNTVDRLDPAVEAAPPAVFLFGPLVTEALDAPGARFRFTVNRPATVRVDWGREIPDFDQHLDLGAQPADEDITFQLDDLPAGQRLVFRLTAQTAEGDRTSGYHWVFTPGH